MVLFIDLLQIPLGISKIYEIYGQYYHKFPSFDQTPLKFPSIFSPLSLANVRLYVMLHIKITTMTNKLSRSPTANDSLQQSDDQTGTLDLRTKKY